ncbi:MAG: acetyl-CoA carboxylase carboxyltransferase subunit beta [Clostridiales bacterium]|nr:acetyl-CoA carboxylase carboxyltransferase subunit beta [Clostridiales bacterium]
MLRKGLFKKPNNRLESYGDEVEGNSFSIPEELVLSCPSCKRILLVADLTANGYVCAKCGAHFKMSARLRADFICDEGSFLERDGGLKSGNPLQFPQYGEKLKAAMLNSAQNEAVLTGTARIGGSACAFFAMEPSFMMGSMGTVVGEKITRLFEHATAEGLPVVGFTVSGGARMQEGILSLMQMVKTSGAVKRHSDAGLLYIAVLTDPTTGGVTASFAMEADIIVAEPGALIGFAGPRVIEQTIRQKLPAGFQRAEFLLEKGFVDDVVARSEQRAYLARLLLLHGGAEGGR